MDVNFRRFSGNKEKSPLGLYEDSLREVQRKYKVWQMIGIASFAVLVISIAVCMKTATLPKTNPLVIYVSDWGEAKYMGDASKMSYTGLKVPQVAVEYQMRKFVNNIYSLSTDGIIVKNNLTDCYSSVTAECAEKLTSHLKADDPRKKVGQVIRTVDVESIIKLSQKSYQIDFVVTEQERSGKVKGRTRMRGVLEIEFLTPAAEDMEKNPLGIYISNFDFTVVSAAR